MSNDSLDLLLDSKTSRRMDDKNEKWQPHLFTFITWEEQMSASLHVKHTFTTVQDKVDFETKTTIA